MTLQTLLSSYPAGALAILLATGVLIGLLGGLLGIGGGVVAVPVLLEILPAVGVAPAMTFPLAVGTAQASILVASLSAANAHWRGGTIDFALLRNWLPALALGTVAGLAGSFFAPAKLLTAVFAIVAAGLALKMVLGPRFVLAAHPPGGTAAHVTPALIGALSSAVAVGAGTLSTPALSLFSFPIQRAIGAGSVFNIVVALPATLTFLLLGAGMPGRSADTAGSVALIAAAALSLPGLVVAPFAARLSARAPLALLRHLFALCLGAIAVRMLLKL
jgi:uncharacterized membrane protein YfcA